MDSRTYFWSMPSTPSFEVIVNTFLFCLVIYPVACVLGIILGVGIIIIGARLQSALGII